jgi:hypothetical protein
MSFGFGGFGQSAAGGFGGFGQTQAAGGFGQPAANTFGGGGFGQSAFGASAAAGGFGVNKGEGFGQPVAVPAFGGSTFGAHPVDDVLSSEDDGSDHDDLAGDGDGEQSEDEDNKHEMFLKKLEGLCDPERRKKLEGLCDPERRQQVLEELGCLDEALKDYGIPLGTRRWLLDGAGEMGGLSQDVAAACSPNIKTFLYKEGYRLDQAIKLSEVEMKAKTWPLGVRCVVVSLAMIVQEESLLKEEQQAFDALAELPQKAQEFLCKEFVVALPLGVRRHFLQLLARMRREQNAECKGGSQDGGVQQGQQQGGGGRQPVEKERERERETRALQQKQQQAETERGAQRIQELEKELSEQKAEMAKHCAAAVSSQRKAETEISELKAGKKRDSQMIQDMQAQVANLECSLKSAGEREQQQRQHVRARDALAHRVVSALARTSDKRMARKVMRWWQHAAVDAKARDEEIERCKAAARLYTGLAAWCEAVNTQRHSLLFQSLRRLQDLRGKMCSIANTLQPLVALEPPLPPPRQSELVYALRALREGELDARSRRFLSAQGLGTSDTAAPAMSPGGAALSEGGSTVSQSMFNATPGLHSPNPTPHRGGGGGLGGAPFASTASPQPATEKGVHLATPEFASPAVGEASPAVGPSSWRRRTPASMTRVKRGSTPVEMLQRLQQEGKLCGSPAKATRL